MTRKVIGTTLAAIVILTGMIGSAAGQTVIDKKVDSLFVIASSGEAKFQKFVQPAVDSLGAMGLEVVPYMIKKLDTKSPRERIALIAVLKKVGSPAVPQLIASLKLINGLSVERACMALAEIADSSSVPALNVAATHPRWRVREEALGALGKIHDPRSSDVVINALQDSIGLVRKAAAVADGQMKLGQSTAMLVHMLGDDFYGARMCAAASLLKLDTSAAVKTVMDSLNSSNQLVGNLGCYVLGQLGTPEALDALLYQTEASNPDRRAHAAEALVAADSTDQTCYQSICFPLETDPLVRLKVESAMAAHDHGR
ncbi:MAG TPA: HEAT repeat domain-containing protein [Candidatus Acidoferrum sp.]|nr:HEAT repeat domain-containing protein [Candidatus Acidoferrum sp.]